MSEPDGSAAASVSPTRVEVLGAAVARLFPDLPTVTGGAGELTVEVPAARLPETALAFRDHPDLKFEMCMDVCGVDYLEHGRAEWKTADATSSGFSRGVARRRGPDSAAPEAAGGLGGGGLAGSGLESGGLRGGPGPAAGRRFAVVYHLLSLAHNHRVRLKVFCVDDGAPIVDSVCGIWASADWFERETFDLFGILFKGHPDLRRLLTDYGFIGHPFRKDFPLSGNVEVRYDPEKGRVVYQPVTIEPRILVPKVIRHDNRYDPALTNANLQASAPAPAAVAHVPLAPVPASAVPAAANGAPRG